MDVPSEPREDTNGGEAMAAEATDLAFLEPDTVEVDESPEELEGATSNHLQFDEDAGWANAETTVQFDASRKPMFMDIRSKKTGDRIEQLYSEGEVLDHRVTMGCDRGKILGNERPVKCMEDLNPHEKAYVVRVNDRLKRLNGPPVMMKAVTTMKADPSQTERKKITLSPSARQVTYVDADGNSATIELYMNSRATDYILRCLDEDARKQEQLNASMGYPKEGYKNVPTFKALTQGGYFTFNPVSTNKSYADKFSWANWERLIDNIGTIGRDRMMRNLDAVLRSAPMDRKRVSFVMVTKWGPVVCRVSTKEVQVTKHALGNLPKRIAYVEIYGPPRLWHKIGYRIDPEDPEACAACVKFDILPGSCQLVHLRRVLVNDLTALGQWGMPTKGESFTACMLMYDAWDSHFEGGLKLPIAKLYAKSIDPTDAMPLTVYQREETTSVLDIAQYFMKHGWGGFESTYTNRMVQEIQDSVLGLSEEEGAKLLQFKQAEFSNVSQRFLAAQRDLAEYASGVGEHIDSLPGYWVAKAGKSVPEVKKE